MGKAGMRLVVLCLALGLAQEAWALNIILNYNAGASVAPAGDPTGALLTQHMEEAEAYYQDIFEDSHTLTINFWWENISGTGLHSLVSQSGGRETEANIRLDNGQDWYFDPDPSTDTEFNMTQLLWRDLSASQQSDLYNFTGSVPDTFEVNYTGVATGAAAGKRDLLSTVLHEVGHALGMSSANTSTQLETADSDYDFASITVGGSVLAVEVADGGNIAHLDASSTFLMDPVGSTNLRKRPSHTDLLAMAAGHSYTSLDIPRREFFGGAWTSSSSWIGNTVPGSADDVYVRNHGGADLIADLQGTATGNAANLFISEGADVDVNDNTLNVFQDLFITDTGSLLTVNGGGVLNVSGDEIDIANSAIVQINAAAATTGTINAGIIDINSGTTLRSIGAGDGVVNVTSSLSNNGTISSSGGGTLTINGTGIDLDGASPESGKVDAQSGDIVIAGSLSGPAFNGEIEIDSGQSVTINDNWTLSSNALLDLNGGTAFADRAQMNGGTITMNNSTADISVTGIADINAPVVISNGVVTVGLEDTLNFDGTANVSGGTFTVNSTDGDIQFNGATTISGGTFNTGAPGASAPLSVIMLDGATTYAGGTITVNGVLQQNGNATVSTDTTVNGGHFDLDGNGVITWTINKTLTLNVDGIERITTNNLATGTYNINNPGVLLVGSTTGGNLDINLPGSDEWTMQGVANLDGSVDGGIGGPIIPSMISGSDVNVTGTVNVVDRAAIGARVDLTGTANINGAASELWFRGGSTADPNTISGGTITGTGTFQMTDGRALHGNGTISATTIDIDGNTSELLAQAGTLTISSTIADVGVIGTEDATGALNVTTAWNTANAFDVVNNGGAITGANITNPVGNTIRGFGTLSPNNVINDGAITAESGGTMIIDTAVNPDLDGFGGNGILNAIVGNIRVIDPVTDQFDGTINVGASRAIIFDNGWTLSTTGANGDLNLNGGGTAGTAARVQGLSSDLRGTITVTGIARLQSLANTFYPSSTTNINGVAAKLLLEGDTTVEAGATMGGGGTLQNTSGNILTLLDGVAIGINLENDGLLNIGASPGTAKVGQFEQTTTGVTRIELQGLAPGTGHDELVVSGDLILDGRVNIIVNNPPHVPVLGNVYTFMPYGGSRSGIFETVGGAALSGLFGMAVRYDVAGPGLVDVRMSIRGDTDFDDDVDTADLTNSIIGFSGAGVTGNSWVDGDFDGDGDTDTGDITQAIINFTGASAANPNVPDLIYDPATGNVTIDADGADVISFSLQSGPFSPADFSGLPAGLTDNIATQIGWTSFNLFSGLTGTADLGNILPTGLNQDALEAALTTASYGLALSGGGGGGRLDIIIPEPASMVLLGLGAMTLIRRRRAA